MLLHLVADDLPNMSNTVACCWHELCPPDEDGVCAAGLRGSMREGSSHRGVEEVGREVGQPRVCAAGRSRIAATRAAGAGSSARLVGVKRGRPVHGRGQSHNSSIRGAAV